MSNNLSSNNLGFIQQQHGFTLTEMIVVLSILILITSIVIVDYRQGERLQEFRLAVQNVVSVLRSAQTSAITGYSEEDNIGQRYGVFFSSDSVSGTQYLFFKDNDIGIFQPTIDPIIETINLPLEISINKITIDDVEDDNLSVVFNPPKPNIFLNGSMSSSTAKIFFTRQFVDDYCGLVTFNRPTGQVSFSIINETPLPSGCL